MKCPNCGYFISRHDLAAARRCLDILAEAGRELMARTCGGSAPAALERELMRGSAAWRK